MSAAPESAMETVESAEQKSASASSQVEPPPWESPQWQEAVSQNPGLAPFFDNLESFVELPEGVEKLRELFLDLAVRGKLVQQDHSEGDGATLLAEVAYDRVEYLKAHGLKKGKSLKPPVPEEFQVPANWTLTHLNDLAYQVHYGYTASADENLRDVRMLRITDIQNNIVNWDTVPGCEIEEDKVAQYELADNDLLIARTGGTIGKTYLIQGVSVRSVFASYLIRVIPSTLICAEYLKRFLECPFYWRQLRAKSAGTGQPNVNATSLKSLIVPLPPLAEQRRIVSKVEGLMSLCDTLESQRRARESVRERASRSVLASLTSAPVDPPALAHREPKAASPQSSTATASPARAQNQPTSSTAASAGACSGMPKAEKGAKVAKGETLQSSWRRLSDHFEVLLDQPSGPKHLRQSILQLAVQGKLVPQDPSDEPASTILEYTEDLFARLVMAKKLKKPAALKPVEAKDEPYDLPNGWAWCRFGKLLRISSGDGLTAKNMNEGTVPVYGGNGVTGHHDEGNVDKPTLVIGRVGFYCGSVHITPSPAWVTDNAFISTFDEEHMDMEYMHWMLKATDLRQRDNATAQPVISGRKVYPIILGVPPKAEQKRIVSKVSALLSQLDELSARLRCRQSTTDALLTALIHQILEGTARADGQ